MNIALIPARKGSKRIPNKNMLMFCGLPLIHWSIEQAFDSVDVDMVYVSTDCPRVREYAEEMLCSVIIRPPDLAQDSTTTETVIEHAIEEIGIGSNDRLVLLQPTSPLRLPNDIDNAISASVRGFNVVSVSPEPDLFLWKNDYAVTFDIMTRKLHLGDLYRENGSIYVINVPMGHNRYGNRDVKFYEQKRWQCHEIDEPEDIGLVSYLMQSNIIGGRIEKTS